ncbi:MAG: transposase [Thermodesulfovibrionales bacterium]|nr:transposase [Thermodesulfovibrionales bacterium]
MKQRRWTAEEKMAIVMEEIKGSKSVAELCRQNKISQVPYYRLRDKFPEGGKLASINGCS